MADRGVRLVGRTLHLSGETGFELSEPGEVRGDPDAFHLGQQAGQRKLQLAEQPRSAALLEHVLEGARQIEHRTRPQHQRLRGVLLERSVQRQLPVVARLGPIAKLKPELGGGATQTGSLLGTPEYMAPEQASGRPVDARTDLYAMGVILFECMTGTRPFRGDSLFDMLRKHIEAAPPMPRSIRPELPPALEHVILTALAKAPEQRFQTAEQMAMALQAATAQLPPEQWAMIGGGSATSAMRAPSGAQSYPRPTPAPSYDHHAVPLTTTAGQVGAAAPASRSGLWIALGAVGIAGIVAAGVIASKHDDKPATPTTPTTIASPVTSATASGGPLKPGEWFAYRALQKTGWDPKHIDVDEYIAWATQIATATVPDAKLNRIDVQGVFPDGHADLTMSTSGFVTVRFISPSRAKVDPSTPVGASPNYHCMFQVMATVQTGPFITPSDGTSCEGETENVPHCTTRGVWQELIAKNAPSGNAVAQLGFWSNKDGKPPQWYGNVGKFSAFVPDACP